jgi:hypothetical protein
MIATFTGWTTDATNEDQQNSSAEWAVLRGSPLS